MGWLATRFLARRTLVIPTACDTLRDAVPDTGAALRTFRNAAGYAAPPNDQTRPRVASQSRRDPTYLSASQFSPPWPTPPSQSASPLSVCPLLCCPIGLVVRVNFGTVSRDTSEESGKEAESSGDAHVAELHPSRRLAHDGRQAIENRRTA